MMFGLVGVSRSNLMPRSYRHVRQNCVNLERFKEPTSRELAALVNKAAREALHAAGLDKYHLPPNIIGAMLRNEQNHYKLTDQWQDEEVARTGKILLKNGKEGR